jgi:hypothetical protein
MAGCPSQQSAGSTASGRSKINYASVEEPLQALISWITSQLQSSAASKSLALVTPTLMALVGCPEARLMLANSGGIEYLYRHLRGSGRGGGKKGGGSGSGASVQQLYELCFCLWTLTYECNGSALARIAFSRDNAVSSIVEIIAYAPREKAVRVALSALRTLPQCTADGGDEEVTGRHKKEVTGTTFWERWLGAGWWSR